MFTNTLPGNTSTVLQRLKSVFLVKDFYLTGGTALSLQIGHRESQDLDFFSQNDFEPELVQKQLEAIGSLENVEIGKGTLNCFLDNVKLQFLHYPYQLLEPNIHWEGIQISTKLDIACTKLITVSVRGSKKDFIDIYFLLREFDLRTLFEKLKKKYLKTNYNETHILKSLVYFVDAEEQPLPRMHIELSWEEVKENIINKVKNFEI
ncbi:MAG: nucleotidyl transferase AbiEii/AbiGii toxin family protein [Patescibacteria group bacterium]